LESRDVLRRDGFRAGRAARSACASALEVGAGNGELAAALAHAGYEMMAIDPASESPNVRAVPLHELDEPPRSFDAAAAVVSLHHVQPLATGARLVGRRRDE